jgi:hypothetical protein
MWGDRIHFRAFLSGGRSKECHCDLTGGVHFPDGPLRFVVRSVINESSGGLGVIFLVSGSVGVEGQHFGL